MKRSLCLLLLCALFLCACTADTPAPTEPAGPAQKLVPKPLTWADIDAIPIANDNMTEEELRQICVDYFRLQLSFQWMPKENLDYEITGYHKPNSFPAGQICAGIPYMNPSQTGNLYVLMDYYDSETGLLDNTVMDNQTFALRIGNNCASGSFWGWARVVNSTTDHSCRYACQTFGFLPVGPYTYDENITEWNTDIPTETVCKQNGEQTMYASYAQLKPADGLVCHYGKPGNAHMRMAVDVEVVYTPEGDIDGEKSFVTYLDQGSGSSTVDMDGHKVLVQGGLDKDITFKALFRAHYLPFTFAELIGQDPVEPAEVTMDLPEQVTAETLCRASVEANYAISSLILTVCDKDGKEVYRNNWYPQEHDVRQAPLYGLVHIKGLESYAGDAYTVSVSCRVGTGQLLTAWSGPLAR